MVPPQAHGVEAVHGDGPLGAVQLDGAARGRQRLGGLAGLQMGPAGQLQVVDPVRQRVAPGLAQRARKVPCGLRGPALAHRDPPRDHRRLVPAQPVVQRARQGGGLGRQRGSFVGVAHLQFEHREVEQHADRRRRPAAAPKPLQRLASEPLRAAEQAQFLVGAAEIADDDALPADIAHRVVRGQRFGVQLQPDSGIDGREGQQVEGVALAAQVAGQASQAQGLVCQALGVRRLPPPEQRDGLEIQRAALPCQLPERCEEGAGTGHLVEAAVEVRRAEALCATDRKQAQRPKQRVAAARGGPRRGRGGG